MSLFLKGLAIGFAIAATVGPISLLCIRRTLADGRLAGLVAGLGAATADAIYGAIAAFGLTLVVEFLVEQQQWLALGGGLFLCWLGLEAWRAEPAGLEDAPAVRLGGLAGGFGTTLLLTLANPVTILSFAAVFAGLGLTAASAAEGTTYGAAFQMVAGVFIGSAAWWLLLSGGVGFLRHRLGPAALRWLNRLSGVVLLGFGLLAVLRAVA